MKEHEQFLELAKAELVLVKKVINDEEAEDANELLKLAEEFVDFTGSALKGREEDWNPDE